MTRNWKEILLKAKEEGLYGSQVAAREGVSKALVSQAQKRHGIYLVKGEPGFGWKRAPETGRGR